MVSLVMLVPLAMGGFLLYKRKVEKKKPTDKTELIETSVRNQSFRKDRNLIKTLKYTRWIILLQSINFLCFSARKSVLNERDLNGEFEKFIQEVEDMVYDSVCASVLYNSPITDKDGGKTETFPGACLVRDREGGASCRSFITMSPPRNDFQTFWYLVVDQKVTRSEGQ